MANRLRCIIIGCQWIDWKDRVAFGKKCLYNIAAAGMFSSDRAIRQYAETIWDLH